MEKDFIERVLKKSGTFNNGRYDNEFADHINSFFGAGEYENTILLLEVPMHQDIPIDIYNNVFEGTASHLVSSAFLIYEELDNLSSSSSAN